MATEEATTETPGKGTPKPRNSTPRKRTNTGATKTQTGSTPVHGRRKATNTKPVAKVKTLVVEDVTDTVETSDVVVTSVDNDDDVVEATIVVDEELVAEEEAEESPTEEPTEKKQHPNAINLTEKSSKTELLVAEKKSFDDIVGSKKFNIPDQYRDPKYRSLAQVIFSDIIFGSLVAIVFAIIGLILAAEEGFSIKNLMNGAINGAVYAAILVFLFLVVDVIITVRKNQKLIKFTNDLSSHINDQYGLDFDSSDALTLLYGFRLPVNVDDNRKDVKLTTLRRGRDARLVDAASGYELPVRD